MKAVAVLALALLLVSAPVATAAEASVVKASKESRTDCGGPVCKVLCFVLTRLGRPCPRAAS